MDRDALLREALELEAEALAKRQNSRIPGYLEDVASAGKIVRDTAVDAAKSAGSGFAAGASFLVDAPGNFSAYVGDKAGDLSEMAGAPPDFAEGVREAMRSGPMGRPNAVSDALDDISPQIRGYEPQTTVGEFARTAGEFAPGAMLGPGNMAGNILRYGVLPGFASEAAGQATEGTKAEPYARVAAALATPLLTGRPTNRAKPVIPRADPEDARMAETLMRNGIRPTVGQVTDSNLLRRMEGSLDFVPGQMDDVTAAAMRTTGSSTKRATPEALAKQSDKIVQGMDDAVAGVSFQPTPQMAQQADDVIRDYSRATAEGSIVPDVRNIADEIIDAATRPSGGQVALSTLKDWRSRLGRLLRSGDPQARDAAWGLRSIIDSATEDALSAAGRAADVDMLKTLREQYRNWLAVADASTRAGAESGILSPTQLNQSVIRSQGRRNMAVGATTPLGDLSRSAAGILRPAPSVSAGGVRTFSPQLLTALLGGAIGQSAAPGPAGMALGAVAGAGAQSLSQAVMRSKPIQSLMMDPIRRIAQSLLAAPGAAQQTK